MAFSIMSLIGCQKLNTTMVMFVYETAKDKHLERCSGKIRNWELREEVWLNPAKEKEVK